MAGPLETMLEMEPKLFQIVNKILAGPCFTIDELPTPTDAERAAPSANAAAGSLLEMMEATDADDD